MIRAVIVDDEVLARDGMRAWIAHESDIEIVGEANDGPTAVSLICDLKPQLLFLDVQMPGFDAFEVLEQIASQHLPAVVFVTAHDQYAVQAFEARALDYLLKPISSDRFREAVERVRLDLAKEEALRRNRQSVEALLDARRNDSLNDGLQSRPASGLERLVVRDRDRFLIVKAEEVDWIESAANYVQIYARGRSFLLRTTMTEFESQLDPSRFARIHRSIIVNVDRVQEITPSWHGDFNVTLTTGVTLKMSRGYRNRLLPD